MVCRPPTPAAASARPRSVTIPDATPLGVTLRVVLVLALGAAILFWPYKRECGVDLIAYLVAIAAVAIGGLWTVFWSWRHRMALAHAISMILIIWSLALAAAQVLPRVGYAKVDPTHPPTWWCE
jgi:heme A synthase